jgi:hypothetical protein
MDRMAKVLHTGIIVGLALVAWAGAAGAQPMTGGDQGTSTNSVLDDNFRPGWREASLGAGAFFSDLVRTHNRPNCDYGFGYAQAGYRVTEPEGDTWLRGSFEVAPEVFGAGIFHGPGNYVAGATLWLHYDFVPKGWRVTPYIAGGGGGTLLDIPHYYDGKDFNFNLDGAVGVRYFIRPKVSLNAEYRFQHISNADLWDHNVGVNTSGPMAGVSIFF